MSKPGSAIDLKQLSGSAGAANNEAAQGALRCLMCEGAHHRVVFTELGIDILRCNGCGHVFSSFRADPHYSGFWGDEVAPGAHYYWSKARARMHRDFFQRFIAGRSGRLLDMGSGLGFFLKAMAAYPSWDAHGCEISQAAVKYAREQLGLGNIICSRLQDADLPRGSLDIITMWDVIDHLLHPDPLLAHCHALLKKGGMLFIRTPNISVQLLRARLMRAAGTARPGMRYLQAGDHAHHYSMRSMQKLLERNGFVDVSFVHLPPIETGEGWHGALVNLAKHASFQAEPGDAARWAPPEAGEVVLLVMHSRGQPDPRRLTAAREVVAWAAERLVLVSTGTPYDLMHLPSVRAAVATYGDEPVMLAAAARVLSGEIPPRGRLPVEIPGHYPAGHGIHGPVR